MLKMLSGNTHPSVIEPERFAVPRYPPFREGLPYVPVEAILESQDALVSQLQQVSGLKRDTFDRLLIPVLRTLADWIQLLPASEQHHHCGAGGLFRHSLEVAVLAGRLADSVIFASHVSPLQRKACEVRWRAAVVVAGLLHDVGKPLSDLVVSDAAGTHRWQPLLESLSDWTQRYALEQYYLHWRVGRGKAHEQQGLLLVPHLVPTAVLAWLTEPGQDMLQSMLLAIACLDPDNKVSRLILEADRLSVSQDLASERVDHRESVNQLPLYQRILRTMRQLLLQGHWQVNVAGGRVWVLAEGVYVVWGGAAADIHEALTGDAIPGVPRDEDFLADELLDRGLATAGPQRGVTLERYWLIAPQLSTGEVAPLTLRTLKLRDPDLLFEGATPAPVAARIEQTRKRDAGDSVAPVLPVNTEPLSGPGIEPSPPATQQQASIAGGSFPEDLHWLQEARDLLHQVGKHWLLEYSKGLQRWMPPTGVLARVSELGWLEPDPAMPMRKVRELGGHRGLVFNLVASQQISAFLAVAENAAENCSEESDVVSQMSPRKNPRVMSTQVSESVAVQLEQDAIALLRRVFNQQLAESRTLNNGVAGNEADGIWVTMTAILADPAAVGRLRNVVHRLLVSLPSALRSGDRIFVSEATIRALRDCGAPDAT
jgi:conjugal transfer pilus assembly protein TraI